MVEKPLGKCITTKILNSTYVVKERNGFCYNDFLPSQAIVCFLLHNKVRDYLDKQKKLRNFQFLTQVCMILQLKTVSTLPIDRGGHILSSNLRRYDFREEDACLVVK